MFRTNESQKTGLFCTEVTQRNVAAAAELAMVQSIGSKSFVCTTSPGKCKESVPHLKSLSELFCYLLRAPNESKMGKAVTAIAGLDLGHNSEAHSEVTELISDAPPSLCFYDLVRVESY